MGGMGDLTSGLTTRIDQTSEPWRLRVEAIGWLSPFRATALRVGDTIVVADGTPPEFGYGKRSYELVGQYAERARFEAAGHKVGDLLKLWCKRGVAGHLGETFAVEAPLAETTGWRTADNRELLGPGGPITIDSDDFRDGWGGWEEKYGDKLAVLLDPENYTPTFNAAFELRDFVERHGERVAFAVAHYPGAWSAAVKQDYDRALAMLAPPPVAAISPTPTSSVPPTPPAT